MVMSPHTVSSVLLPWPLWLLLFLTFVTQTTSSAPVSETSSAPVSNSTLFFSSGRGLRNCSCSGPVRDCDQALANAVCRCHSVVAPALHPGVLRGPRGPGGPGVLTLWVTEPWVLQELLNGSTVAHLRLSFCGVKPLESGGSVALLGLRTLRIYSALPRVPFPEQEVTISPPAAGLQGDSSLHVTFLDLEVLNGLSALKAYSVLGSTAQTFIQDFPLLFLTLPPKNHNAADSNQQNMTISFVY